MEKILLFGGTFDPPHKGHLHLLHTALEQVEADRVLLIPAFIPPHKDHTPALSFDVRCGVLKDWFGHVPNLEISDVEQKRGGKSFTVDTVETILAENPNSELYLLIGTDMFLSFETWHRFQDLLSLVTLVVGSREVGDRKALNDYKTHLLESYSCKGILLCEMEPVVCASSDLRAAGDGLAQRALEHIGKELNVKRARHTMQVADYAKKLAVKYGVDPEKAYLGGLLHDCTRCYSTEWHIDFAQKHGQPFSQRDLEMVLHQFTGAIFAREILGATDPELLSAIACHTTGKANMSDLDMLLMFADSCEPGRDYPGVQQLREAGEQDLKQGTLMLIESMIASLSSIGASLHPQTLQARECLTKELKKNG